MLKVDSTPKTLCHFIFEQNLLVPQLNIGIKNYTELKYSSHCIQKRIWHIFLAVAHINEFYSFVVFHFYLLLPFNVINLRISWWHVCTRTSIFKATKTVTYHLIEYWLSSQLWWCKWFDLVSNRVGGWFNKFIYPSCYHVAWWTKFLSLICQIAHKTNGAAFHSDISNLMKIQIVFMVVNKPLHFKHKKTKSGFTKSL